MSSQIRQLQANIFGKPYNQQQCVQASDQQVSAYRSQSSISFPQKQYSIIRVQFTIDLPKIGQPDRLFLAAVASATYLNTTKACPLILLFLFTTIWRICPQAQNRLYRAYLRSMIGVQVPLGFIFSFRLRMYRVYFGEFSVTCFYWIYYSRIMGFFLFVMYSIINDVPFLITLVIKFLKIRRAQNQPKIDAPLIYLFLLKRLINIKILWMQKKQSQKPNQPARSRPYSSMTDFLNNYKPISKFIDFNKLKLSQYIDFVEDKDGYYYGEIVNQFRNGQGVLYAISGAVYEGFWTNGHKNVKGFQKYQDGSFYEGDYHNGKYHGNGIMYYMNGDNYDGQWVHGKKQGTGSWKTSKGLSYLGEWMNNKMEGYGVLTEPNGEKYEGIFKNGKKSGKGVLKYQNGDIYKGYFQEGQFNGFGEFYWANGNSYRGQFRKGKCEGPGELRYKYPKQKKYEGYFKQNKKSGYGIYTWSSGSCYKGFFQRDLKHGYGEMFWPDGNIYRGWWKDGAQHGKGELFVIKEGLMRGVFNNNHLVVLTEQKSISKAEYQKLHTENPQIDLHLPEGIPKKIRNEHSKEKVKFKNRKKKVGTFKVKKQKLHKSIPIGSLDTIQFPLLFHHHSRLKTEKFTRYEQNISEFKRHSTKPKLSIQMGEREKNLHSFLGVHKTFLKSIKNSESTMPDYPIKQKSSQWNKTRFQKF